MVYFGAFGLMLLMALVSRIHYSKYKDGGSDRSMIVSVLAGQMRKTRAIGEKEAQQLAADWLVKRAFGCFLVLALSFLLGGIFAVGERNRQEDMTLAREGYDGREISQKLFLTDDDEMETLELKVEPLSYTKETFDMASEDVFANLTESIRASEQDGCISEDLTLPLTDEGGSVRLSWTSDRPDIMTSYGKLAVCDPGDYPVNLTVKASAGDFERAYTIGITVRKTGASGNSGIAAAKEQLIRMEEQNRNMETLTIPEEIDGVSISMKHTHRTSVKIVVIGVLASVIPIVTAVSRLREEGAKRDEQLLAFYPEILARLSLLVAAGMTIRAGLKRLAEREDVPKVLIREIHYTLHRIDAGQAENLCYEALGYRLELPEYQRLFDHISNLLTMGNDQLLKLMKDERVQVLAKRREYVRQRGETASTKMLFPMIILLALTMLVIIYPAFAGF